MIRTGRVVAREASESAAKGSCYHDGEAQEVQMARALKPATAPRTRRPGTASSPRGRGRAKSEATLLDEKHAREFAAARWSANDIDRAHDFDLSGSEMSEAIERARAWHAEQREIRAKRALSGDGRRAGKGQG